MKKKFGFLLFCLFIFWVLPSHAEQDPDYESGFVTQHLNSWMARTFAPDTSQEKVRYGRHVTDYVGVPNLSAFVATRYMHTWHSGETNGGNFDCHFARISVNGTLLRDFRYRVQLELRNTPAMRDYTLEWMRWQGFQVKVGQFKRGFTLENQKPVFGNGFSTTSQLARRFSATGLEDPSGESPQNGRDVGIQLRGNLLPVGEDRHTLFSYQVAMMNGNGQNKADNNKQKDWIGSLGVSPLKNLQLVLFGWHGTYTANEVTVRRKRWALSGEYVDPKGWCVRGEYAYHFGHNVNDFDKDTGLWTRGRKTDAWYAMTSVPITDWLLANVRYDVYRDQATWNSTRSMLSFCPNFQLHKNLYFQVQYNFVSDHRRSERYSHELIAESWVRF